jgi:hypothetical protein
MATIDDMVRAGVLEPYELPEWETRQPFNRLWVAQDFWLEFDAMVVLHDASVLIGRRTIGEHIELLLNDFRCSKRPSAGDLKRMTPTSDGVWKLHPPGARVYGWCPFPESFVAVTLATEQATKSDKGLNNQKRKRVVNFVKTNGLQTSVVYGDILAVFPPKT